MEKKKQAIQTLHKKAKKIFRSDYQAAVSLCDKAMSIAQESQCRDIILECMEASAYIASYSMRGKEFFESVNKMLAKSQEWNNYVYQEKSFSMIGAFYWNSSKYQQALEHFQKSEKLLPKIKNPAVHVLSYRNFGLTYSKLGDNQKADDYLRRALRWANKSGDKAQQASVSYWLANNLHNDDQFQKALGYYYKALALFEKNKDIYGTGITSNSIGLIYRDVAAYRKSSSFSDIMMYFEKAKECAEKCHEIRLLGDVYNNIGLLYYREQDWEQTLKFYNLSLNCRRLIPNKENEAITLQNIGNVYNEMKEYDKTYDYYLESLKIRREIGNIFFLINNLYVLLGFLLERDRLKEATDVYNELQKLEPQTTNKQSLTNMYWLFSAFFEKQGNYKEALHYHIKSHDIQNEFLREDLETQLKKIEDKHRLKVAKLRSEKIIANEKAKTAKALACTTCHEISQPMTVLQGCFDLLLENHPISKYSEGDKRYISMMQTAIETINNKLHLLSKPGNFGYGKYVGDTEMIIFNKDNRKQKDKET